MAILILFFVLAKSVVLVQVKACYKYHQATLQTTITTARDAFWMCVIVIAC